MNGLRKAWKDAALWAVVVAVLLEFAVNVFAGRSLWHRVAALEDRVSHLEAGQK